MNKEHRSFRILVVLAIAAVIAVLGVGYVLSKENSHKTEEEPNSVTATSTEATAPKATDTSTAFRLISLAKANPYGCYGRVGSTVYVGSINSEVVYTEIPTDALVVPNADADTFKDISPYGICFGVDKNHVYRNAEVLRWADPKTFKIIGYIKPGPVLFLQNGNALVTYDVAGANADELTLGKAYTVIPSGDPSTLKTITGAYDFSSWAADKNNVYCKGKIVAGADPSTAKTIRNGRDLQITVDGETQALLDGGCTLVD